MARRIGRLVAAAAALSFAMVASADFAWAQRGDEIVDEPLEQADVGVESSARENEESCEGADCGVPSPADEAEAELRARYGVRPARVAYLDSMNDRQGPAARPGDFVLDPEFRGFIPIPNTVIMMKLNVRPRVDMMATSDATGTPFRFVPSEFRVPGDAGYSDAWRFSGNANGSQVRLDFRAPSTEGNFRLFYQNDFFGDDSKHMRYRLQHLYAQYMGVVAGYTFGIFENPDAWPDTVDYEGPNAVVFARRALIHYQISLHDDLELTLGLEDPNVAVDTTVGGSAPDPNASSRSRAPDGGFNLRWTHGDFGHAQLSSIFRSVGVDGGDTTASQDEFGWGLNLSGVIQALERTSLQYWFVYGDGVGGMGNDTSFLGSDAAFTASGDLMTLQYWSAMGAVTQKWTNRLRSTISYGYVNLENASGQAGNAYHESHYGTANVIFRVFKRMSVGVEGMYGRKEVYDGRSAGVYRIQLGLTYGIFD